MTKPSTPADATHALKIKSVAGGGERIRVVFMPLAAGYFLSYFFRNVNGPIAADLIRDIGVNAAALGLLTAVFFLAFAAAQIPIGVMLDRFGPRPVQAALLLLASAGALLFGAAHSEFGLVAGRLLIGLGTAGCLMAGLKAMRQWFAMDRLSSINGSFIMCGGLGALAATTPLSALVGITGWRGAFDALALAAFALAVATYLLVPNSPDAAEPAQAGGLKDVFHHRLFWRFAPMSAASFGAVTAFQGLWAAQWFTDVERLKPDAVAARLLIMACGLIAGAPLLGFLARRLRARLDTAVLAIVAAASLVFVEAAIALRVPLSDFFVWPILAGFGAIPVLSYGVLAGLFPDTLAGRANSLLNIFHTLGAFGLQSLIGIIVSLWPRTGGIYPAVAYQSAIMLVIVLQTAATLSFALAVKANKP